MNKDDYLDCNTSSNPHILELKEHALANPSRRSLLKGGVGLSAVAVLPGLTGCNGGDDVVAAPTSLPALGRANTQLMFTSVAKNIADSVTVPTGYSVKVVHATGDRLDDSIAAYGNLGQETDDWSRRVGDHHDGMWLFYIDAQGKYTKAATDKAVLAVNHESSADAHFFHPRGQTSGGVNGKKFDQFGSWDVRARPGLEVLKEINHHGVSIVELQKDANGVFSQYKLGSMLNRRITAQSLMNVTGPAAHLAAIRNLFVTKFDTTGATARGTLNNCGSGDTPWGTFLTCEENWAVYTNIPSNSTAPDAKAVEARRRYGVARAPLSATATAASGQGWYTPTDLPDTDFRFSRWNSGADGASAANDFRNEPNTFGYNVEIDPLNPTSTPAKRVAMGRFAHESAACSIPVVGRPLAFYMGCDSRNEYVYKFVTAANWDTADIGGGMAAGNKYLNEGKLYVAKFNSNGNGEWIELTIANPLIANYSKDGFSFANQAEVFVFTRLAADAVGATKMDRPEWASVNPLNGEVYLTMTNNSAANRTPTSTDAANPRAYTDADGKKNSGNPNGHIIRFKESGSLSTATAFTWDIFVFGAEEDAGAMINVSELTTKNSFSSPDGLWFSNSTPGLLWIQTDDGSFTDETHCMLLAAIPGTVGDGRKMTIANTQGSTTGSQETFVGGLLGEGRLLRFLTGPKGAEITGVTESADGKSLFVNIQHPGENTAAIGATATAFTFESTWPSNGGGIGMAYGSGQRPRSATIVITRNDGGKIAV